MIFQAVSFDADTYVRQEGELTREKGLGRLKRSRTMCEVDLVDERRDELGEECALCAETYGTGTLFLPCNLLKRCPFK